MQLQKNVSKEKKAGAWYFDSGIALGIGSIGSPCDAVADVSDENGKLTVTIYEEAAKAHGAEIEVKTGTGADIQRMMTISTAHISSKTGDYLSEDDCSITAFQKDEYGWFIYTGYVPDNDNIPEDLITCIRYASEHGCDWLCLDGDGPEIKGLPVYLDWF